MIKSRQASPLFFALTLSLGAPQLLAQAPATDTDETPPATSTQPTEKTTGTQQAPRAQSGSPSTNGEDSPFEYRSSEEISEDVSVSFPVDI